MAQAQGFCKEVQSFFGSKRYTPQPYRARTAVLFDCPFRASPKLSSDLATMLLEDDENLNHLYYGVFQRVGYRVSQAHTVAQALEVDLHPKN